MRIRSVAARRFGQLRVEPGARQVDRTEAPTKWRWIGALIFLALVAYGPVIQAGFIWDDDAYVTGNKTLRDTAGLARIWFDRHANPQYYPLVYTTFWMEYHLWGQDPLGYHLVNVLLHAANAVLLLCVLRRLAVPGAFWAAALFAVHPVAVESVAWITERKNVLSTLLYLGSFLALLRFWPPEERAPRPEGRWRYYALALVLFTGALFSKTVVCSLPAAFLLVRWWKLGALSRRDWLAVLPLFVIGLGLGLHTALLEKEHVGARGPDWDLSFTDRALIAGRALWFYAVKLVWPAHLTFIYPRWDIDAGSWRQCFLPVAALAVVAALWALRRRWGRGPLAAVLFFAGTLTPALGFFNVYPMRFSFVADHFQYLASIGLLVLLAAGMARLESKKGDRHNFWQPSTPWNENGAVKAARNCACPLFWLTIVGLAALSWQQTRIYKDALTLWNDTLTKNPQCWLALTNRGFISSQRGDFDDAFADFCRAIALKDSYEIAYNDRGLLYQMRGQRSEAVADFQKAIELRPSYADPHCNLGLVHQQQGETQQAIDEFTMAIALQPDHAEAYNSRGTLYQIEGRIHDALEDFNKAVNFKAGFAEAHNNRGEAHRQLGETQRALDDFNKAIAFNPNYADPYSNRGLVYLQLGQRSMALDDFNRALELKPDNAAALLNRALAYHHLGKLESALPDYSRVIELRPDCVDAYNNRADIFVRHGQLEPALHDYDRALALKPDSAAVYFNRAVAHYNSRQYDKAWNDVQRGQELGGQPNPALLKAVSEAARLMR